MLLGKNFDDIDASVIQELVNAGAPETIHLDFKRDTYGSDNGAKKEFLKDVSAMCNTLGGHLIIGIDEDQQGNASSMTPFTENADDELLRLEQMARTGIEPVMVGLRMKKVPVDGGHIFVIQVPRSHNPPHRVTSGGSNKYYGRGSAGCHELSMEELRLLFGEARSVEERAKAFVSERFLRLQANDGAMPLPQENGLLTMHLVPLPDFGANVRHTVNELEQQQSNLIPIKPSGYRWRINLDGYNVHSTSSAGQVVTYAQLFRTGAIEAVSSNMFREYQDALRFAEVSLCKELIEALSNYMKSLTALDASPPVLLQISATGIAGLSRYGRPEYDAVGAYEREVFHLPHTIIREFRDDHNYEPIIAEQMGFLWNIYGLSRCPHFDDAGNWDPR